MRFCTNVVLLTLGTWCTCYWWCFEDADLRGRAGCRLQLFIYPSILQALDQIDL